MKFRARAPGAGEAVIRVTLTTICGTDLHIVRGGYPVKPVLIIGHEPVGVIEELGPGVTGFQVGDRVLVGAITPCGQCHACLSGHQSQCGHGGGYEAVGGWRFGNTINGAQAEYLLVPYAQANMAKIPDELSDEGVVIAACRYLDTITSDIDLSLGLGSRHFAAASISKATKAIGIVVSESALVRVFADGALIAEVLPELWLLSRRNVKLHAPFS